MKPTIPKTIARFAGAALFAVAAVLTARADYPSSLLSLNPAGYWRFNDTATSPPLNVITNAGTLGSVATGFVVDNGSTTPLLGQSGVIGTSIRFSNPGNTVGLCASKIEVPWNAALNSKPPFSIEFWAKPNSLGADGTGFSPLENFNPSGNSSGNRSGWLFYLNNNGRWNFRLGSISGYALNLLGTSGNASAGTWQHIAVTWDGAVCKMYANGSQIASGAVTIDGSVTGIPWYQNPVSFLRFGGSPLLGNNNSENANSGTSTIGNRGYDGYLQHVAIYNQVLTPSQIGAHYSASTTNNAGYVAQIQADAPAGYWTMNDAPLATPAPPYPLAANSGTAGSAADATNYPGVLVGQPGPGYAGFGSDTKAIFVDGVNGSMQVDDTAILHFTGKITLTAWVKPLAQDYFRDIIAHGYNVATAETFLRMSRGPFFSGDFANFTVDSTGDGFQYYEIGATDGGNYYDSAQFQVPSGDIGNWVFLAGTCDGSNWNLYRNGALVATVPVTASAGAIGAVDLPGPWTIGSRMRTSDTDFLGQGENFNGSIFQPAIFTNALTALDIQNLYLAGLVPPVITQAPVNPGLTFKNSTVNFTVVADGAPTLGYMWISNGVPTGNTTTSYSIPAIQNGTYSIGVMVTNAYGTNTPTVTFTVVPAPPVISVQPLPQKRYVGYPFTLSVTAGGTTPLTYFWYLGSTLIQAGSSPDYSAVASLLNGGNYSVVVSNETSLNVTSSPTAVTVSSVPTGYPASVVGSTPLSYWRLDETSGTTAYDFVSGNNGTYKSIPPTTLGLPGYEGLENGVANTDTAVGFSGNNSYVGNISGTAINFTNNNNFTLEAWVNAPAQTDEASIIAKGIGNSGTTRTEQFALDVSTGTYRFFTTRNGFVFQANASTGPNGTWQHVVGVYDGQNALGGGSKLYIYVNGVLEGSANCPINQSATTTAVSIGSKRLGNDPAYDGTFNGTVDDVAIYSSALSASTVFSHYAAAFGATIAPYINVQPVGITNYVGLPLKLSVAAAGSVPLTYTWHQGNTVVGGNSSSYSVSSAAFGDAGYYYVNIANGLGSTNSVTNYVAVLAAPTTPPTIPGLVMHLPFNGNLTDVTGRGNNGTGKHSTKVPGGTSGSTNTVSPGPATSPNFYYVTDGPFPGTNALHYSTVATNSGGVLANGASSGIDDYYVTLGVLPDLQFGASVDFTVAFWVRTPLGYGLGPDYGGGGDLPFFTTALNSLGGYGFDFATPYAYGTANPIPAAGTPTPPIGTGGWGCSFYGSAATGVRDSGATGAINDGGWHHLVFVVNRTTGIVTTFLDGVSAPYTIAGGTKLKDAGNIDSGNPATIGQDPTGLYGETGSGDIADLGVWRRALTPLEAASIYVAGFDNGISYASGYVPPDSIKITKPSKSGDSVTINWLPTPVLPASNYFTYSVLSTTSLLSGSWTTNATGITTTSYIDTTASGTQKFYRVTSP